jgi:hypothetical protein
LRMRNCFLIVSRPSTNGIVPLLYGAIDLARTLDSGTISRVRCNSVFNVFLGLLPFVGSVVIALGAALSFKVWYKRRRRRSPLQGRRIGMVPGQALVDRIADHDYEVVAGVMLMYIAAPIMFSVWASNKLDWSAQRMGVVEWFYVIGVLVMLGYGFSSYMRHYRLREKARDGLLAERVTGMQLNRLTAQGCAVLHDIEGDGFNIDHVVVAPRGVYMVETKSFRKPRDADSETSHRMAYDGTLLRFPDFATDKPLKQARRQKKWLEQFLRESLQRDIPVIAAVALPGWWVDMVGSATSADVRVFSPLGRGCDFIGGGPENLDATLRALVSQAIALRYPQIGD